MDINAIDFQEAALAGVPEPDPNLKMDPSQFSWLVSKVELLGARVEEARQRLENKMAAMQKAFDEAAQNLEHDYQNEARAHQGEIQRLLAIHGPQARLFVKDRLARSKGRSFKIGSTQFGYRKTPDRLVVDDEAKVIQWAYANGLDDVVQVSERISLNALKTAANGVVPDGCRHLEGQDNFYAKFTSFEDPLISAIFSDEPPEVDNAIRNEETD
jgi:hypothetical protein